MLSKIYARFYQFIITGTPSKQRGQEAKNSLGFAVSYQHIIQAIISATKLYSRIITEYPDIQITKATLCVICKQAAFKVGFLDKWKTN